MTVINLDLHSSNCEIQALAVTAIANIGGKRMAQAFNDVVTNILMSP